MAKVKAKQDTVSYEVIVQDTDDGSGDVLIPIPQELLDRLGWDQNTQIDFGVDKTGRLIIKKSSK